MKNVHITPKDIQKGVGTDYQLMEVSLAAANIDWIRTILKKAGKEVDKVDNECVNSFKIIASFKLIKDCIDGNHNCVANAEAIDKLVAPYTPKD